MSADHWRRNTDTKLQQIFEMLWHLNRSINKILQMETKMAGEVDALAEEIAENTNVVASASQLLDSIKQKLDEAIASGSMDRVRELSASLDTNNKALAEAVARNTPSAPPAPTP